MCSSDLVALVATVGESWGQGNPVDIRRRDDAERAQRDYRDAIFQRNNALDAERAARLRNQMLPEPGPVPPANANTPPSTPVYQGLYGQPSQQSDPALRIQQEETARLNQLQYEQARRNAEEAERAARELRQRVR